MVLENFMAYLLACYAPIVRMNPTIRQVWTSTSGFTLVVMYETGVHTF